MYEMLVQFIPLSLIILFLISIILIMQGRKAVMMGNWFRHRNFMLPAVLLGAITIALTIAGFALAGLPVFPGGSAGHLTGWALVILHVSAMAALIILLPWTLYRIARHLIIPHKTMARWTFQIWLFMSASGMAMNGLRLLSDVVS